MNTDGTIMLRIFDFQFDELINAVGVNTDPRLPYCCIGKSENGVSEVYIKIPEKTDPVQFSFFIGNTFENEIRAFKRDLKRYGKDVIHQDNYSDIPSERMIIKLKMYGMGIIDSEIEVSQ